MNIWSAAACCRFFTAERECNKTEGKLARFVTIAWLALLLFLHPASAQSVRKLPDETIIVTANAYPVPFENLSRSVAVLTKEDIRNLPARSIADALAHAVSVNVRSRSPFGLQADVSVRGSAFSQVLILVNGMRINDSQTGHHNADIPVQLQDVERIEILLGSGSSIYGADAFGGIINIITRKNAGAPHASISAGQNKLVEGSFSAGFKKWKVEQSISTSAGRSSGFQYDRDFRSIAVGSQTKFGERSTLYASHVNKEFGANGFYGPAPSKEWTNQTFVSFDHSYKGSSGVTAGFQGYYRTHGDRFLYDIRTPGLFESRHRTHAAGAQAKVRYGLDDTASLTLGAEAGGDWIDSNRLGQHSFARTSLFGELQWTPTKSIAVYPGLRFDYYSNFGSSASPSLSGSWWILPRLRLRSSVGRAFRIPTFTELYYQDPNHQANSTLKPETSWSAEIGSDLLPAQNWIGSMTLFARRERNVIDWIRFSTAEKWQTFNIRELQIRGVEFGLEHALSARASLSTHYSRISVDAGRVDYISKYVLDYARDSWTVSAGTALPLALKYQQTVKFIRHADGRSYWLLDGRLERRFHRFTAVLDLTNLLNSRYQEITGVDMPGRWLIFSLNLQ